VEAEKSTGLFASVVCRRPSDGQFLMVSEQGGAGGAIVIVGVQWWSGECVVISLVLSNLIYCLSYFATVAQIVDIHMCI
jgi:hypothetical protein